MAVQRTRTRRGASKRAATGRQAALVFAPRNYHLLLGAVALIVIGYTVMRAENEVDGFLSLYVAPVLLLAGYVGVLFAILWRPRVRVDDATVADPALADPRPVG